MRLFPLVARLAAFAPAAAQRQRQYGVVTALIPDGMTPRYLAESYDAEPIIKRVGTCGAGRHPCLDVRRSDRCCSDSTYCFINKDGDPKCCPIGNDCRENNPCNSDSFFCTQVSTVSGTMRGQEGCCGKQCRATSAYLCPSSLGGNCCSYGSDCQSDGRCVSTVEPTSTGGGGVLGLTPVPEGCTTSQYKCEDGEGCCNNDQKCTEVSDTAYCAQGTPTGTDVEYIDGDDDGDSGLSTGAQAGIGVGVTVAGGLIIGLATWFCITRRRRNRSTPSRQTGDHSLPTIGPGGAAAGVGAGAAAGGAYHDDNMTEYSEPHRPWQQQQQNRVGGGHDYFGPAAVAGPFTDNPLSPVDAHSPPLGAGRAVPSQPQKPGDIAAPVEIDSTGRTPGTDDGGWLSPNSFSDFQATPLPEGPAGRVELYGGEVPMSPPAAAEEQPRKQQ